MVTRTGIDFTKVRPPSSRRAANAHRAFALDGFDSRDSMYEKSPHQKAGARKTVLVPAVMSAGTFLAYIEAV